MTAEQVTVQRALLEQVLYHIVTGSPEWDIDVLVDTLRTALDAPVEEPEMHEAMCPALTGCKCNCPTSPAFVDRAWAQFCGGVGRGPGAPYPGMIEAFEAYYGQSFTDSDWRNESSIWAAAWKAVKAHQPPANVPMLTEDEIVVALHVALPSLPYDSEDAFINGMRAGEQAVRQKAGLK